MLDVGAGDGTLIDALARQGREAVGLEREAGRPDVRDEPLGAIGGEWAAVVFWHSLEHLPDPGDAVRHAARLLAPGGVLVVAVPDAGSLQARIFGDAGCTSTRRAISCTSRRARCWTGSRAPGCGSSASRAPAAARS